MGPKVTIDSASLMNKALELIEARHLFNVPPERLKVVIHPQSLVHSMVELCDGSFIAQMSKPDMRFAIQYAPKAVCRSWISPGWSRSTSANRTAAVSRRWISRTMRCTSEGR